MENEKGEIVDLYVHLFPQFLDFVGFSAPHWDLGSSEDSGGILDGRLDSRMNE